MLVIISSVERVACSCCMGPRLWNDIPNDVKQCVNVETFKKKLKTFLFNKF